MFNKAIEHEADAGPGAPAAEPVDSADAQRAFRAGKHLQHNRVEARDERAQWRREIHDSILAVRQYSVVPLECCQHAGGHWVFAGGLADPAVSTVIDGRGEEPVFTDGPFIETKEWAAGFWIIEADDLDVALKLMAAGSRACNRRLEVRPLLQEPQ